MPYVKEKIYIVEMGWYPHKYASIVRDWQEVLTGCEDEAIKEAKQYFAKEHNVPDKDEIIIECINLA